MKQRLYFFIFLLFSSLISISSFGQKNVEQIKAHLNNAKDIDSKAKIIEGLVNEYIASNQLDSVIKYGKIALPIYEQKGDIYTLNKTKLSLALIYASQNDITNAKLYLPADGNYFVNQKDYKRQARYNYVKATMLLQEYKADSAKMLFNKILDYYDQKHDVEKSIMLNTFNNLYGTYVYSHEYGKALQSTNKYIAFAEQHFPEHLGYAYFMQGNLYRSTSEYDKAANAFSRSLHFYEKKKDLNMIAASQMHLGITYMSLKKTDSAKVLLNDALQYYQAQKGEESEARIYNALSATYFEEKNLEKAETYILKALDYTKNGKDNYLYDNAFMWTIKLAKAMKDSTAIKLGTKDTSNLAQTTREMERNFEAILAKKDMMSPGLLAHNYHYLSEANAILGNYEKALKYFKANTTLKDSVYNYDNVRSMANMESSIVYEKQNEILKLEEASKRLHLQKELELKALKFEYERKQAAAKTEEERQRLLHEEELKRKEIEIKFAEEQKAVQLKYEQEKQITKIEQEKKDALAAAELQRTKNVRNLSALGVGLATLLLGIATWSYFQKRKDNKRIADEKQKSDELLLNILPQKVADELKENGKTIAQLHNEVSVLFTDFVNFTSNAEKIGVQELLNELNDYFTVFDKIMEQYGLEKIKTIGDAYLAVSGLPASNPKHAQNAVLAAKAILAYVQEKRVNNPNALDIRIGINSGAVVAGIVGVKKFAYDIWGDAVNTAARMEQNSQPGKINISASTYQLVQKEFNCEARGKISTKGKGEIEMYFVS